jgi:hypothetical protein
MHRYLNPRATTETTTRILTNWLGAVRENLITRMLIRKFLACNSKIYYGVNKNFPLFLVVRQINSDHMFLSQFRVVLLLPFVSLNLKGT